MVMSSIVLQEIKVGAHTIIPVDGRYHTWKCHAKTIEAHHYNYGLSAIEEVHCWSTAFEWMPW